MSNKNKNGLFNKLLDIPTDSSKLKCEDIIDEIKNEQEKNINKINEIEEYMKQNYLSKEHNNITDWYAGNSDTPLAKRNILKVLNYNKKATVQQNNLLNPLYKHITSVLLGIDKVKGKLKGNDTTFTDSKDIYFDKDKIKKYREQLKQGRPAKMLDNIFLNKGLLSNDISTIKEKFTRLGLVNSHLDLIENELSIINKITDDNILFLKNDGLENKNLKQKLIQGVNINDYNTFTKILDNYNNIVADINSKVIEYRKLKNRLIEINDELIKLEPDCIKQRNIISSEIEKYNNCSECFDLIKDKVVNIFTDLNNKVEKLSLENENLYNEKKKLDEQYQEIRQEYNINLDKNAKITNDLERVNKELAVLKIKLTSSGVITNIKNSNLQTVNNNLTEMTIKKNRLEDEKQKLETELRVINETSKKQISIIDSLDDQLRDKTEQLAISESELAKLRPLHSKLLDDYKKAMESQSIALDKKRKTDENNQELMKDLEKLRMSIRQLESEKNVLLKKYENDIKNEKNKKQLSEADLKLKYKDEKRKLQLEYNKKIETQEFEIQKLTEKLKQNKNELNKYKNKTKDILCPILDEIYNNYNKNVKLATNYANWFKNENLDFENTEFDELEISVIKNKYINLILASTSEWRYSLLYKQISDIIRNIGVDCNIQNVVYVENNTELDKLVDDYVSILQKKGDYLHQINELKQQLINADNRIKQQYEQYINKFNESEVNKLKEENKFLQKRIDEINLDKSEIKKQIEIANKEYILEIEKLKNKNKDQFLSIESLEIKINELNEEIKQKNSSIDKLQNEIQDNIKKNSNIIKNFIIKIKNTFKFLNLNINSELEPILQVNDYFNKLKDFILNINSKITDLEDKLSQYKLTNAKLVKELDTSNDKVESQGYEIARLNKLLEKCTNMNDDNLKLKQLNNELKNKLEQEIELKNKLVDNTEQLRLTQNESITNTQQELKNEIDKLNKQISEYQIKLTTSVVDCENEIKIIKSSLFNTFKNLFIGDEQLYNPNLSINEYIQKIYALVNEEINKLNTQIDNKNIKINELEEKLVSNVISNDKIVNKEKEYKNTIADLEEHIKMLQEQNNMILDEKIKVLDEECKEKLTNNINKINEYEILLNKLRVSLFNNQINYQDMINDVILKYNNCKEFSNKIEKLTTNNSELKSQLSELATQYEIKFNNLELEKSILVKQLEQYKKQLDLIQNENNDLKTTYSANKSTIEELQIALLTATQKVTANDTVIANKIAEIDKLNKIIDELTILHNNNQSSKENEINLLNNKIQQLENDLKLINEQMQTDNSNLQNNLNDITINNENNVDKLKNIINSKNKIILKLNIINNSLSNKIEKLKKANELIKKDLIEYASKYKNSNQDYLNLQKTYNSNLNELNNIKMLVNTTKAGLLLQKNINKRLETKIAELTKNQLDLINLDSNSKLKIDELTKINNDLKNEIIGIKNKFNTQTIADNNELVTKNNELVSKLQYNESLKKEELLKLETDYINKINEITKAKQELESKNLLQNSELTRKFQEQINNLSKELTDVKEQNNSLNATITALKQEINRYETEKIELMAKNNDLVEKQKELEKVNKESMQKKHTEELQNIKKEKQIIEDKLNRTMKELDECNNLKNIIQKSLEDKKNKCDDNEIAKLNALLNNLTTENDKLQKKIIDDANKYSVLSKQFSELNQNSESEINELKKQFAKEKLNLENTIKVLETRFHPDTDKLKELQSKYDSDISVLKQMTFKLAFEKNKLNSQIKKLENTITIINKTNDDKNILLKKELSAEIMELKKFILEKQFEINKLKDTNNSDKQSMLNELANCRKEFNNVLDQINKNNIILEDYKNKNQILNIKNEQLQLKVEDNLQKFNSEYSKLNLQIETLKAEIVKLEQLNTNSNQTVVNDYENKIKLLLKECSDEKLKLQKIIRNLNKYIATTNNKCDTQPLIELNNKYISEIDELKQLKIKLEFENLNLSNKINKLNNTIQVINNSNSNIQNNLKTELNNEINRLNKFISEKQNLIEQLKLKSNSNELNLLQANANLTNKSNELNKSKYELNKLIEQLKINNIDLSNCKNDNDKLKLEVSQLVVKIKDLEMQISYLNNNNSISKSEKISEVNNLNNTINNLQLELDSCKNNLETEKSNTALISQIKTCEAKLSTCENNLNAHTKQCLDDINKLNLEKQSLQNNLDLSKNVIAQLELDKKNLEEQINTLSGVLSNNSSIYDNNKHNTEIAKLKQTNLDLSNKIKKSEKIIKQLQTEKQNLESKSSSSSAPISTLPSDNDNIHVIYKYVNKPNITPPAKQLTPFDLYLSSS